MNQILKISKTMDQERKMIHDREIFPNVVIGNFERMLNKLPINLFGSTSTHNVNIIDLLLKRCNLLEQ